MMKTNEINMYARVTRNAKFLIVALDGAKVIAYILLIKLRD